MSAAVTETSNNLVLSIDDSSEHNEDAVTMNQVMEKHELITESGMPLIYYVGVKEKSLIDIFREDISIARISDDKGCFFHTREGWLLFERCSAGALGGFLHNIITGARLDLPDIKKTSPAVGGDRQTIFTTRSSSPTYVFSVRYDDASHGTVTSVCRPGDKSWKVHVQRRVGYGYSSRNMAIVGTKVYDFDGSKRIAIFDLEANFWYSISGLEEDPHCFYIAEVEGKIVKVCLPNKEFNSYRFYRLLIDGWEWRAYWVEMAREELANRSWFLDDSGAFSVKGAGKEAVYRLMDRRQTSEMKVEVYDLVKGTTEYIIPCKSEVNSLAFWVDRHSGRSDSREFAV